MKKTLTTIALLIALSSVTLAGNINGTVVDPPPPPPPTAASVLLVILDLLF